MAGLMTWEELERHGLTECDPRDRAPLDQRLFPGLFGQSPNCTREVMNSLRDLLTSGEPVGSGVLFADDLRAWIKWLRDELRFTHGKDLPSPEDIDVLRASMRDAITHVEGWAKRHGIDKLNTAQEDTAARQGWPDETGNGWTPPWDILGMAPPDYWGSPDQSA